jgi:hypothetical protein
VRVACRRRGPLLGPETPRGNWVTERLPSAMIRSPWSGWPAAQPRLR